MKFSSALNAQVSDTTGADHMHCSQRQKQQLKNKPPPMLTETEIKETGISKNLWICWKETMDALWSMANKNFNGVVNDTNAIVIGPWKIQANFINQNIHRSCSRER
jgi:hypothetical protein